MKMFKLFLKNVVLKVAVIAIAIFLLLQFVVGFYYFRGNSMFPNVKDGDYVMTWKLSEVQTNDVILYKDSNNKSHIGRVVAKGGDTVSFTEDGELMVNGSIPSEEVFYPATVPTGSKLEYPYTVPENEYFILNDYRTGDSKSYEDSRTYGSIPESRTYGTVTLLFRRRGF